MSPPDTTPDEPLQRDADAPPFAEPWEAQAFALTLQLYEAGHFTWREWADTLAAVLKDADTKNPSDDGRDYYRHWLTALERLSAAKKMANPAEVAERKQAWESAYATTPHGEPVSLGTVAAKIPT